MDSVHFPYFYFSQQVPLPVEKINSTEHPVKVGLSDAFMALLSSPQSPGYLRFNEFNIWHVYTFILFTNTLLMCH